VNIKLARNILRQLWWCLILVLPAQGAALPAGKIVWWGDGDSLQVCRPKPTNGVIERDNEMVGDVIAIAARRGNGLAVRQDGTVFTFGANWLGAKDVPVGLSNVVSVAAENDNSFWAIKRDGSVAVWGFHLVSTNQVAGLSNVMSVAFAGGGGYLAIKNDGTVLGLRFNGSQVVIQPVKVAGQTLSNVVAAAAMGNNPMVVKKDGSVWSLGNAGPFVPYASANPIRVDGVVLSNVVAMASGWQFGLALTTGNIPSNVYIQPHGRLAELERKADLIFKGEAVSNTQITNAAFNITHMKLCATKFRVISVLKGEAVREVGLEHYSGWGEMWAWSGPSPPAFNKFEPHQTYLVFAARMDKPDSYYSPLANVKVAPDEFRQIADVPRTHDEGAMKTLDQRSLPAGLSVKEAHWFELNRLLNDANPTNVLYAIGKLDQMSLKQKEPFGDWRRSDDFKRSRVLSALLPLINNENEQVATCAIGCFEMESTATNLLKPFAGPLITVANTGVSSPRRLAAIRALSGMNDDAVSNSLAQLLKDGDENIRAGGVGLLPRFPAGFAEEGLRHRALDVSPQVRAAVADAIGNGKIVSLLPVLETLWIDTNLVHASAGTALLKFDVSQVNGILKAHLNAEDFKASYLCQLAKNDAGPWLTNLVDVLKVRRETNWVKAVTSGIKETTNYFNCLMALSGTDFNCWNCIHDYLVKLPDSAFQDGKLDWCLDVLEDAGNTGSREPVMLYELYKTKGLNKRAAKFRQENGKCSGFDVTVYFDNVDKN